MDRINTASKQEIILQQYLASKNLSTNTNNSNTPSSKLLGPSGIPMKVLPPLKASSSLERASIGPSYSTKLSFMQPSRHMTAELERIEVFKKRDLRGGKRTRQSNPSVGKPNINRNSSNKKYGSTMKSERLLGSIAQASPSTQEDSVRRTFSSRDNNSTGRGSNENLQTSSPKTWMGHTSALQVIENLEFVNPMEEMTRRW